MLNWLFKKGGGAAAQPPAAASVAARSTEQAAVQAAAKAAAQAADAAAWRERLNAAQGDDAALLALVQAAPLLEVKIAAVEALASEAALKQAERASRDRDRKVHRVAKQRLEAAVAQRVARTQADALLARATELADAAELPVNHLVELDRQWQALPASALQPGQIARHAELRARLDAALHEQDAARQDLRRWMQQATSALQALHETAAVAAQQGAAGDLAPQRDAAAALLAGCPALPASAALESALAQALQAARGVDAALAWLEAAPTVRPAAVPVRVPVPAQVPAIDADAGAETRAPADAQTAAAADSTSEAGTAAGSETGTRATTEIVAEASSTTDVVAAPPVPAPATDPAAPAVATSSATRPAEAAGHAVAEVARLQDWDALLRPLPPAWAAALGQRRVQLESARRPVTPAPLPATAKPPKPPRFDAALLERCTARIAAAEHALAEGQLGEMRQQLQHLDADLEAAPAPLPDALRARVQALRAEDARLKGWQRWGGKRAREDMVAEAEALALGVRPGGAPEAAVAPRIDLTALARDIQALRQRWKELDRTGADAAQALWQRFDAALHTAYQPLAERQAVLKAARQENRVAREALLAALEALPLPDAAAADAAPDWKLLAAELNRFQLAWRKLGPIEHTAPSESRDALLQRMRAAVERVDRPLQTERERAGAAREALVAAAESLLGAGSGPPPELARRVRELQAQWGEQARRLPLERAHEQALWARFRAATDAAFAQRDAAHAAREAEWAARLAEREAVLARLTTLPDDADADLIERTLVEVDRAWREAGEPPRGAGAELESRLRTAHEAVVQRLRQAQRRGWQALCDALAAALAQCEAREDGGDAGTAAAEEGADGADALPAAWGAALAQRRAQPPQAGPRPASEIDQGLVQLETALGLPPPPAWQDELRRLKLQALKDTLEGRRPQAAQAVTPAQWLPALLRQGGMAAAQRERLHRVVAALREAAPGTFVAPAAKRRT